MSGINPQGCQVYSFKSPSAEELDHDYMWRCLKLLPEKGKIGIFNRSYYEEVLVVKVHKELLEKQNIPKEKITGKLWEERYEDINNIEKYFHRNRIVYLKLFLNISKEEQKLRFLKRINTPEKNWKFSLSDLKERNYWDDYIKAFEDMLNNTSTKHSPWYIVPANNKWYSRAVVSEIVVSTLESLNLKYPEVSDEHKKELLEAKRILESEK
jgi:PPK2 family polyphosphate:nucleotide phosphotransferase